MMKISKEINLKLVGVGKVGMSIVQAFSQAGFRVYGIDTNKKIIEKGLKASQCVISWESAHWERE